MEGEIILILVFVPIALIVGLYRLFNHGEYPCVASNTPIFIFNQPAENI